jgi:hypothetical protein
MQGESFERLARLCREWPLAKRRLNARQRDAEPRVQNQRVAVHDFGDTTFLALFEFLERGFTGADQKGQGNYAP